MHSSSVLESQLVGDIYDAALRPALWAPVIEQVSRLVGAEKANLLAYDHLNAAYFMFHSYGTSPEELQYYQDGGFAAIDKEFTYRWAGSPGEVRANHLAFPSIEDFKREAGRLYTEFFSRAGILYQAGALLEKEEFRWSVLGVHRGERNKPFESDRLETLARLVPHMRRALQIHRQVTRLEQLNTHLYRLLDRLATGVILVDGQGRVRYTNRHAEAVLRCSDRLRVTSTHQLVASPDDGNPGLQETLQGAIRTSRRENLSSRAGGLVSLSRKDGGTPLMITVTPLSELAGYEELAHDGIAAALYVNDPSTGHILSQEHLRQAYGLSEREIDVCQKFVNHPSVERTAELCGITVGSARTYLKSIYQKTGKGSQAELVRLLTGLAVDFEHVR